MSRRGPIVAGVVFAIVAILAVVLLVLPKMNEVKRAEDELIAAQDQELTLQAQLQSLQEAQVGAPETKRAIRQLESQVPPTADLPALIRLLREAADRSAVDFFSVSPGSPVVAAAGGYSTITTSISVTGKYFTVVEFLYRLETLPRAAKVMSISIAAGGAAEGTTLTGSPAVTMTLTVEFYTTDVSAGPGSIPGPTTELPAAGA